MTTRAKLPTITRPEPEAQGTGFAKVFGFLREQLLEGVIRSGDRLLPERELASQLDRSRLRKHEPAGPNVLQTHGAAPPSTCRRAGRA